MWRLGRVSSSFGSSICFTSSYFLEITRMRFHEVVPNFTKSRAFGRSVVLVRRWRRSKFVGDGSIIVLAPAAGRVRGSTVGSVLLFASSTSKTC